MPPVRAEDPIVALACSDLHLSATPPPARAKEPWWFEAQARPLIALRKLCAFCGPDVPVLFAGDLFDKWNCTPELISFAINAIPRGRLLAIPGQHDIPHHDAALLPKSAFYTLVTGHIIKHASAAPALTWAIEDDDNGYADEVYFAPVPWGVAIPKPEPRRNALKIAMVHRYVWCRGWTSGGYAPPSDEIRREDFEGWDVVICGDNHNPFVYNCKNDGPVIVNCGCMIRRKSDEIMYQPRITVIYASGHTEPVFIPTGIDFMERVDNEAAELPEIDDESIRQAIHELTKLGRETADFARAVRRFLNQENVAKNVAKVILEALERG